MPTIAAQTDVEHMGNVEVIPLHTGARQWRGRGRECDDSGNAPSRGPRGGRSEVSKVSRQPGGTPGECSQSAPRTVRPVPQGRTINLRPSGHTLVDQRAGERSRSAALYSWYRSGLGYPSPAPLQLFSPVNPSVESSGQPT